MRITLARAGPIAVAFDCDLATFGFPFEQARRRGATKSEPDVRAPLQVAEFVAEGTGRGEGGEHVVALARESRFVLHPFPRGATFPAGVGHVVATTPSPDAGKMMTTLDVARELAAGRDRLLVFGLGPRGLPADVLAAAPRHLELTGKGVSLETATAIGAIPASIAAHLQHLRGAP